MNVKASSFFKQLRKKLRAQRKGWEDKESVDKRYAAGAFNISLCEFCYVVVRCDFSEICECSKKCHNLSKNCAKRTKQTILEC